MVTLADADPGAPSRTAATVSEVCTTARAPMSIARAGSGSIPKVTGSRIATAPVPPRPGMSPMTRPARTPTASMSRSEGSAREASAEKAASVMVASSVDRDVVVVVEQFEHVLADAVVDLVGLADAVGEVGGRVDGVAAEHLGRGRLEAPVGAHLLGGRAQELRRLVGCVLGDPQRLLVRVGQGEDRAVGVERLRVGLLAVQLLVDLDHRRQVGEVGVADDLSLVVDLAEGEERHGRAVLDERLDRGAVRRRGLVVDVDLAALQREVDRAAALEAEG